MHNSQQQLQKAVLTNPSGLLYWCDSTNYRNETFAKT
jgi:hypothetical protein